MPIDRRKVDSKLMLSGSFECNTVCTVLQADDSAREFPLLLQGAVTAILICRMKYSALTLRTENLTNLPESDIPLKSEIWRSKRVEILKQQAQAGLLHDTNNLHERSKPSPNSTVRSLIVKDNTAALVRNNRWRDFYGQKTPRQSQTNQL